MTIMEYISGIVFTPGASRRGGGMIGRFTGGERLLSLWKHPREDTTKSVILCATKLLKCGFYSIYQTTDRIENRCWQIHSHNAGSYIVEGWSDPDKTSLYFVGRPYNASDMNCTSPFVTMYRLHQFTYNSHRARKISTVHYKTGLFVCFSNHRQEAEEKE